MYRKISTGILTLLAVGTLCGSEYSEAQAKVKAKYPAEFAEIQKLAATDMDAARQKLEALAAKAKISLPRANRQSGRRFRDFSGRPARSGGRQFGGRGGMGMRMGQFNLLRRYLAEKQIKDKFPAEYAAVDKEFLAVVAKLENLAAKAKVTLPLSTELQLRKLRAKAPEEFAGLEELSRSNPHEVFGKLRELSEKHQIPLWENRERGGQERRPPAAVPVTRENPQQIIRKLRRAYPAEMKKIMALRSEDPREFSRQLQALNRRYNAEKSGAAK